MGNAVFDNFVGGNLVQVQVLKEDAAIGRAQEARDGLERSGFAGAVGANQRDYFTLVHLEGDVPEYLQSMTSLLLATSSGVPSAMV